LRQLAFLAVELDDLVGVGDEAGIGGVRPGGGRGRRRLAGRKRQQHYGDAEKFSMRHGEYLSV